MTLHKNNTRREYTALQSLQTIHLCNHKKAKMNSLALGNVATSAKYLTPRDNFSKKKMHDDKYATVLFRHDGFLDVLAPNRCQATSNHTDLSIHYGDVKLPVWRPEMPANRMFVQQGFSG